MGKHEVGTPKYIANKIKAKGLQKLRWYCQMCQKQCRDENGFKCHTMSESHQRQLLLFADNPDKYLDSFSQEFEEGYLSLLKRTCGTRRVHANQVYQEYISDRDHLHMNATKWETLTDFVKHLGRVGKCMVDETEKGWFVTYIDRDPETLLFQERMAKREKMDKDDQERAQEFIEKQVERGREKATVRAPTFTELKRENEEEVISLDMNFKKPSTSSVVKTAVKVDSNIFKSVGESKFPQSRSDGGKRKVSALDDLMKEHESTKEKKHRKDYWLCEGIVVKVITKSLGDKFYKNKGVVVDLVDKYIALVRMLDSGTKVKLDQQHLETVIPAEGRLVLILNGAYRGSTAYLKGINTDKFSVDVEISCGPLKGRLLRDLPYEDISKLNAT